ncbi:MAG TPA: MFS transporter [Anaerolineaceae bacterium]|nr:MFS transporter [Anaerolineaceae bacterium]
MKQTLAQYQGQIEKNYRWNFFWMAVDNMMFFFIFMGLSPYTVLPYYVQQFSSSSILIGFVPAIYILGNTLPQPLMARFLAGKIERKKYLVVAAFLQRFGILGFLLLAIIQPLLGLSNVLTLVLFFAMLVLQNTASGFYVPAWIDFMGRAIPRKRGILFGISNFAGGLLGIGMGALLTYLLGAYPYQQAIQVIFGISFLASMISFGAILSWREVLPPQAMVKEVKAETHNKPQKNKNFATYLVFRGLMVILEIGTSYYTIVALQTGNITAAQIGIFTTIMSLAETMVNPLFGWLGDKKGFLNVVKISAVMGIAATLMAANLTTLTAFYAIFILAGVMVSGFQITNFNMIYEFSPADQIPAYTAASQIALSPLSGVMPFIGGALVGAFGYTSVFWLSGLVGMTGLLGMSFLVRNPKIKRDVQRSI